MRAAGEVRAAGAAPRTEDIEAASLRSRVRASIARKGLPYALIAPATLVILAVLGWPLLMLFWLSVQHYGLRELFQHQGTFTGLKNYSIILADPQFLYSLRTSIVFTLVKTDPETIITGTAQHQSPPKP